MEVTVPGVTAQSPERKQRRAGTVAPQAPPPASASVIRVHIGRIEVRAAAPAPPLEPLRKKAAKPRRELSLGDYLKQRKGGR
jgi:hypothetical protein